MERWRVRVAMRLNHCLEHEVRQIGKWLDNIDTASMEHSDKKKKQ